MHERYVSYYYFAEEFKKKYGKHLKLKINVKDKGSDKNSELECSMAYDSRMQYFKKYCIPDWTFYHWPTSGIGSFFVEKERIKLAGSKDPKIDKTAWFGNIHSPGGDAFEFKTRPLLFKIGQDNKKNFEIVHTGKMISSKNFISMQELTEYKFLIDIGGNGYSGRLKYLLFSNRPIFLVERFYIEYFHDKLKAYTHYIPVQMDLSDLIEKEKWARKNYEKCLKIAKNAQKFAEENFSLNSLLERFNYAHLNFHKIIKIL